MYFRWAIVFVDLDGMDNPRASALVEASNSVPRQHALSATHHPEGEPAFPILGCGVNCVGETRRARIKLMNDGIGHVVSHHRRVHPVLDVLPLRRKSADRRVPQEICNRLYRQFAQVDHSKRLAKGSCPFRGPAILLKPSFGVESQFFN